MYETSVTAGWGDMDFNAHMANTAYMDKAGDVRLGFFAENGFPATSFRDLGIGPVIRRDEVDYYRETDLLETLRATLVCTGMSADGSRFTLRNEFFKSDGRLAVRITSSGGWLNLAQRKLTAPPPELFAVMLKLGRSEDFREIR